MYFVTIICYETKAIKFKLIVVCTIVQEGAGNLKKTHQNQKILLPVQFNKNSKLFASRFDQRLSTY